MSVHPRMQMSPSAERQAGADARGAGGCFGLVKRCVMLRGVVGVAVSGCIVSGMIALSAAGLALETVHAQEAPPVLALLQRIQSAARTQDYAGVFTHQYGDTLTSARIVHVVDGTGERERLEHLDGEPREYLRHNDTTQCLMPQRRLVIRERGRNDRFPGLLMGEGDAIDQHYRLRDEGALDRVAGRACRIVHLEPRDAQRYGYTLCTDAQTELLLKVQTVDAAGIMDQVAFTSVVVGKAVSPAQLASDWDTTGWRVQDDDVRAIHLEEQGWRIPSPAGYRVMTQLQRSMQNRQVNQLVLSDGLAAISVFIEPMASLQARDKLLGTTLRRGALSIHTARIGDHGLTFLGDVPPAVLQALAQRTQFVPPPTHP